jgi:hypothetical protein
MLLGLADPQTCSALNVRHRANQADGLDITVYDLGGVALRVVCKRCSVVNWLFSDSVPKHIQQALQAQG